MRTGVVGELLVIIALLASVLLITSTFDDRGDVPNIARNSLEQLRDLRSHLAQAIINWLDVGISSETLACNGVYPVETTAEQYAASLRPFIEQAIIQAQEGRITAGDLESVDFGELGVTIRLQNGTIIYQDDTIYAEDRYEKEYDFNVRVMLALQVAEDWLRCDAGNLSDHLVEAYGPQCFFGKKDPGYPGFCLDKTYQLTQADRDYMMRSAITPETVSTAVQGSVDELNAYFAGEKYCQERVVQEDTGITCRYELSQMAFEYEMYPYQGERIALPFDSDRLLAAGLLVEAVDAGDEEYRQFMRSDAHVWSLPSNVSTGKYKDNELATSDISCSPTGREPVVTRYDNIEPYTRPEMVDVRQGPGYLYTENGVRTSGVKPILYVNTTRGSKFTVKVTCTDNRAALLGQPLEYSFSFRHGMQQSCGPKSWVLGTYDCGRCLPRPGHEMDKCMDAKGSTCGSEYYTLCRDSIIWKLRAEGEQLPGQTSQEVLQYMLNNRPEMLDLINQSCSGIIGMENLYPLVGAQNQCQRPFGVVCCGMYGFKDGCTNTRNINNPECFYNADDNLALCVAPKECPDSECVEMMCEPSTGACVEKNVLEGKVCRNMCSKCNANGECEGGIEFEDRACQGSFPDSCRTWQCNTGGDCTPRSIPDMETRSCDAGTAANECAPNRCVIGFDGVLVCAADRNAGTDNLPCQGGSTSYTAPNGAICTMQLRCQGGFCNPVQGSESCGQPPAGGGGCPAHCVTPDGCTPGCT